jgi:hypothetical protein
MGLLFHSTSGVPIITGRTWSPEQTVIALSCAISASGNVMLAINAKEKDYALYHLCVAENILSGILLWRLGGRSFGNSAHPYRFLNGWLI